MERQDRRSSESYRLESSFGIQTNVFVKLWALTDALFKTSLSVRRNKSDVCQATQGMRLRQKGFRLFKGLYVCWVRKTQREGQTTNKPCWKNQVRLLNSKHESRSVTTCTTTKDFKRLTLHSRYTFTFYTFCGNQTHEAEVVRAIIYCSSYRNPVDEMFHFAENSMVKLVYWTLLPVRTWGLTRSSSHQTT